MRALLSRVLSSGRDLVLRRAAVVAMPGSGVSEALALEIDANGSPVTIPEAHWLVCFVPGLERQWWHRFADARHKHVFAMHMVEEERWLLVEPWWTRMMVNVLTFEQAMKFLRWGAAGNILRVREAIPGRGSQVRGWANCAVLISFMLGRSYWTWSPNGLYRRLKAEADSEPIELPRFLGEHLRLAENKRVEAALAPIPVRMNEPLQDALLALGIGTLAAMLSSPVIGLWKAAVIESIRSSEIADGLRMPGPASALRRIGDVLLDAKQRGEIQVDDCAIGARQFVAVLRGDLHLQLIFDRRASLTPEQIHAHAKSVVATFLRGARRKHALKAAQDPIAVGS